MDSPNDTIPPQLRHQTLSPKRSSSSTHPTSPEFEFWSMLRNPDAPDPTRILSADELFSGGVLLPLDQLSLAGPPPPSEDPPDDRGPGPRAIPEPDARPGPALAAAPEPATGSKRWTNIFKKSSLNDTQVGDVGTRGCKEKENKEKLEKRKEKRNRGGSGSPELNINIWPFSRSRSAGNGGTRPVIPFGAPATRKASSAPCSRSNSAGDPKSRSSNNSNSNNNVYRWPSSPGRVGVHVGRSSPIWQPKRAGSSASGYRITVASNKRDPTETKARVLNSNAPTCVAAARTGCRSVAGGGATGRGGVGGSLFNLRGLFTKKVH